MVFQLGIRYCVVLSTQILAGYCSPSHSGGGGGVGIPDVC